MGEHRLLHGIADGDSLASEQSAGMEDLMASLQKNNVN